MRYKSILLGLTATAVFVAVSAATLTLSVVVRFGAEIQEQMLGIAAIHQDKLALTTELYDRRGEKIGEFAAERRYYVRLKDLPPHLAQAFIAVEDRGFHRHFGLDPVAIARSALVNLRARRIAQGASTITQQLARLAFLDQRKTWERKVKEVLLAVAIERRLTKDQILELYLNKIYLGNRSYGVEAASRNYFRKNAADLSIGEAALLAGLAQSPNRYAPHRHPKAADARQEVVLARMEAEGFLAKGDAAAWAKRPVHVASEAEEHHDTAPYFVAATRTELARKFEWERIQQEGLRIYTSLDRRLQESARAALAGAVAGARSRAEGGGRIEGALVTIEPATGAVLAMQGGETFAVSQFNRASGARRRLAGLATPLAVSMALQHGFTAVNRIGDDPMTGKSRQAERQGLPTLNDLLVRGLATEAAPLYMALGDGTMRQYLKSLGLRVSDAEAATDLALGHGTASPFELATAYAAFANGGRLPVPYLVERVEDREGRVLYHNRVKEAGESVMSPASAFITWAGMREAASAGHAALAAGLTPHAAGFAAATEDLHDSWYAGLLSTASTVVWIGAETGQARVASGAGEAARQVIQAWVDFMRSAPDGYLKNAAAPATPAGVAFAPAALGADGLPKPLPFVAGTEPKPETRAF